MAKLQKNFRNRDTITLSITNSVLRLNYSRFSKKFLDRLKKYSLLYVYAGDFLYLEFSVLGSEAIFPLLSGRFVKLEYIDFSCENA